MIFFLIYKYETQLFLRCHFENRAEGKGQLISKCLFGVFTFFQKTNKNKSTSSKVEFVPSFFGRNVGLKKSFRICLTFSRTSFLFLINSRMIYPICIREQLQNLFCVSMVKNYKQWRISHMALKTGFRTL